MSKLRLWNRKKGNDYKFFDRTISEMFNVGGTEFMVHKYVGTVNQGGGTNPTQPSYPGDAATNIQDMLLLENRDRVYDKNIYSLMGSYNVQDNDFDLSQFGLFLSGDTLFIQFHLNDMVDLVGRKLIAGDVLEVPHLRDDLVLDGEDDGISDTYAIPKLYKIEDASRSSEGFSPTWYPHIWRVKISPLSDSQEYRDLLERDIGSFNDGYPSCFDGTDADDDGNLGDTGVSLSDLISTGPIEKEIADAIIAEAERDVPNRNLEHSQLWVSEHNEQGLPHLFMTDGEAPNGATLLGSGSEFPELPPDGSWFLRTDYSPDVLYKREGSSWIRTEVDWREKWTTANRTLLQFLNNRNTVDTADGPIDSKVAVSKIVPHRNKPGPDEVS